ncbi:TetR/AcrR family transcriptional regulator [Streptomyces sp. NP160]|uniref:TetR/AcrR family transcriptional regulator n=1 Tax=Streptomyces sp. NP160 TaxID=2586637 RepID=UPI00111BCD2C|nr:TetR/AcrR family transcriptional regulator [Streptomyces sp. NP160]TNM63141.1 TetR/AcrR family transcriptional regulator [Streptomyces sp. NP160]
MAGPRGEYRKSAERRAQILEAAAAVFARGGYTASSLAEVAREVGMTQTGVLHHFAGGKVALLRAVLEQRDAAAEGLLTGRTGRDFLAGLVEISRTQREQRGTVQLYAVLAAEATDPDHPAHAYFAERFTRIADAVAGAFAAVRAEGGLRPGVEPRRAANSLLAVTEGLQLLWLSGVDVDIADDVQRHLDGLLVEPLDVSGEPVAHPSRERTTG